MTERNVITPPIKKNYFFNTPLTYKGKTYPANVEELSDGNGSIVTKNVFADANGGRHFINDDGTLTDVYMDSGELPEVTVTAPLTDNAVKQQYAKDRRLQFFQGKPDVFGWLKFENGLDNDILHRQAIMKAAGYNVPQNGFWSDEQQGIWNKLATKDKEYDTTLLDFLQGMTDKSNGNTKYTSSPLRQSEISQYNPSDESLATKWKTLKSNNKVVNAIAGTWGPIATTSLAAPYAVEAADAIAGTTAGQAITNGLNFATKAIGSNKAWPFIDAGITSYFGAEGMNELMNGKFTPETAMNLLPFLQMARPVAEESKAGFDFIRDWRPRVPQTKGRYYRIVGTEGDPIRDAIENGVIRGPGANPDAEDALLKAAEETGNRFNIVKAFDYPMFSKDRLWKGTTARVSSKSKPYIIRNKADTGPIVWEESSKDFRHKGHPGIFRPSYYGDVNASPTKYFEYWEPQKFGYVKKDFPYEEPKFQSSLDWSPEGWFGTRVTGNYDDEDIKALNAHLPEYLEIERIAKANNTWLKMPDGSKWEGDPRSWVQMMSKDYNKYTGKSPFKYKPFSHSTGATFDTFDISHFGETDDGFYGRGFYTHPAENIKGKLQGRNSYGDINYLLTTNVQRPFDLRNQNFKNAGLFNWENTNAPKGIFDGYDSVYYGVPGENLVGGSPAELVVPEPNNYKSLLGNNGNFDALNPNIYKVILPLGLLAGTGYYSSKQR